MSIDTPSYAQLMGYCTGTLGEPDAAGRCPACRHDAGLTAGGYVGHHVEEPGLRPIYVDPDESLSAMDACNTPTPGLLIARPRGCEDDTWQVFHAPSALIIHRPNYYFPRDMATAMAVQFGGMADWLADVEVIRADPRLALASELMCFMVQRGLDRPTE